MTIHAVKKSIKAQSQHHVYLIEIFHPQGNIWLNTGYRYRDYDVGDGQRQWIGVGHVVDLEFPDDSSALEVAKFSISLSGVAPELQFLANERVRGNEARIWIAYINEHEEIAAIELLDTPQQERVSISHDKDLTATLTLHLLANFAFLSNQAVERWTPEHQRKFLERRGIDPDSDTGFDAQHNQPENNRAWFPPG